jgi:hypothetical protein
MNFNLVRKLFDHPLIQRMGQNRNGEVKDETVKSRITMERSGKNGHL